jgi:hypothetical protein
MSSPFPGMDPYLESPSVWPDLHQSLAVRIGDELNWSLPSPYYALLQIRPELDIVEEERTKQRIVPHITVDRRPRPERPEGDTFVRDGPRRTLSRSIEMLVHTDVIRHPFVEIRDSMNGHKLVTLIEILSPSNKRTGPDREAYQRKQQEVLESDANLVEIDLLRSGARVLPDLNLAASIAEIEPSPDYLVLVNRAWKRAEGIAYQVFPFGLRDWLPCIPVPLAKDEPEVLIDLQFVFNRVYDGGPYLRGAVDYSGVPDPALSEADAAWANVLLRGRDQAPSLSGE